MTTTSSSGTAVVPYPCYKGGYFRTVSQRGKAKKVRGWRQPTAYNARYVRSESVSPTGGTYTRPGGYTRTYEFDLPRNQSWLSKFCDMSQVPQALKNSVSTAALVEAKNRFRNYTVDYGKALGESRQSLSYIIRLFQRLMSLVRLVTMRRWRKVARDLGHARPRRGSTPDSYWLEYQYAWKPLLSDLFGAAEDLKRQYRENDQVLKVSGYESESVSLPNPDGNRPPYELRLSCRCVMYAKVADAKLHALASMGLTNPAAVIWELVPFSFVVDWFIPVGSWLDAITSTQGLTFVRGSSTLHLDSELTESLYAKPIGSGTTISERHGTASSAGVHVIRTVLTGWSIGSPYVDASPLSPTRAVNALALISQNRKRLGGR